MSPASTNSRGRSRSRRGRGVVVAVAVAGTAAAAGGVVVVVVVAGALALAAAAAATVAYASRDEAVATEIPKTLAITPPPKDTRAESLFRFSLAALSSSFRLECTRDKCFRFALGLLF